MKGRYILIFIMVAIFLKFMMTNKTEDKAALETAVQGTNFLAVTWAVDVLRTRSTPAFRVALETNKGGYDAVLKLFSGLGKPLSPAKCEPYNIESEGKSKSFKEAGFVCVIACEKGELDVTMTLQKENKKGFPWLISGFTLQSPQVSPQRPR